MVMRELKFKTKLPSNAKRYVYSAGHVEAAANPAVWG